MEDSCTLTGNTFVVVSTTGSLQPQRNNVHFDTGRSRPTYRLLIGMDCRRGVSRVQFHHYVHRHSRGNGNAHIPRHQYRRLRNSRIQQLKPNRPPNAVQIRLQQTRLLPTNTHLINSAEATILSIARDFQRSTYTRRDESAQRIELARS